MHGLLSLQLRGVPPTQAPPAQVSPVVQALPSSHAAVLSACTQPVAGSHDVVGARVAVVAVRAPSPDARCRRRRCRRCVQASPSSHARGVVGVRRSPSPDRTSRRCTGCRRRSCGAGPPTQAPPSQVSSVVQASPSLHEAVLLACTQPEAGSHESSVHGLLSSQSRAVPPTQVPPSHVSSVVQALPSSHEAVLLVCTQPDGRDRTSRRCTGCRRCSCAASPPTQVPPAHVSSVVQASPSSHEAVLLVCTQPDAGLHESSVHALSSLQLRAVPPTQVPPSHVSSVVQALPSLHEAVLLVCTQPVVGLQESSVHGLPSSQLRAVPPHAGPAATGVVGRAGVAVVARGGVVGVHAARVGIAGVVGAHVVVVAAARRPADAVPPLHVSFVVQALPSSHEAVLLVCTQPIAGSHVSSVHGLPSSQLRAVPPTQVPPSHMSLVVQALPSSHEAVLLVCTQPDVGSHVSSVHTLPSLQLRASRTRSRRRTCRWWCRRRRRRTRRCCWCARSPMSDRTSRRCTGCGRRSCAPPGTGPAATRVVGGAGIAVVARRPVGLADTGIDGLSLHCPKDDQEEGGNRRATDERYEASRKPRTSFRNRLTVDNSRANPVYFHRAPSLAKIEIQKLKLSAGFARSPKSKVQSPKWLPKIFA